MFRAICDSGSGRGGGGGAGSGARAGSGAGGSPASNGRVLPGRTKRSGGFAAGSGGATATGGRVDPTPAEMVAARDGRARETRPFGSWLIAIAMALVLADVALRRFTVRT